MKHLTLLKNVSDEALIAVSPLFINSLSTLHEVMQKSSYNSAELFNTYVKAKTTKFFSFATEIKEI
jgi:hypothetical protein